MNFHNIYTIHVLEVNESTVDIPTELPCLSDLENPSQLRVRKVLMILSYKLFKLSDYSCFRGQGIHCRYFYTTTLFQLLRKSRSISGSRVPQRHWWLYLIDFHNLFTIYVHRGQGIHCWHSHWATMFEWPWQSKSTSGLRGTGDCVL